MRGYSSESDNLFKTSGVLLVATVSQSDVCAICCLSISRTHPERFVMAFFPVIVDKPASVASCNIIFQFHVIIGAICLCTSYFSRLIISSIEKVLQI